MSEKVHPEEAVSDGEPLLKGEGTRVLITSHGDADSGPWVRIRTGHMAENYKYKQYEVCRNSLCFISYKWTFRQMVLSLIEWKWFDRFILLCIAVISLLNAAEDRRAPEDEGFNAVSKIIEHVINVIFLIELVLKVIGWGLLCHKNAYLRNPWNILDFLVVADAVLQWILPDLGGAFSVLRLFRALRPLRSLNAVPQMKGLVNTVLIAIPRLGNVILMAVFIFGIFAIAGITLMDGIFYRQCRETKEPVIAVQNNIRCWAWNFTDDDRYCGGAYKCTEGYCFGHEEDKNEALRPQFPGGRQGFDWCPGSEPSKNRLNPEIDFIHFDHIGGALLIVFQCMTMEGWTDIMYWVQDANGDILATVYFVLIICVTSHALLNIALAVIDEVRDDFGDEEEEEEEKEENEDDVVRKHWRGEAQRVWYERYLPAFLAVSRDEDRSAVHRQALHFAQMLRRAREGNQQRDGTEGRCEPEKRGPAWDGQCEWLRRSWREPLVRYRYDPDRGFVPQPPLPGAARPPAACSEDATVPGDGGGGAGADGPQRRSGQEAEAEERPGAPRPPPARRPPKRCPPGCRRARTCSCPPGGRARAGSRRTCRRL
mmetsp:Transcript_148251/g.412890  ORF Transcript_148251/g.412890 Transcript_148251/m.412890 type:complete len:596 (-) Transcript_148251:364-2151(-)